VILCVLAYASLGEYPHSHGPPAEVEGGQA
jgi:hypothetical protein